MEFFCENMTFPKRMQKGRSGYGNGDGDGDD
jgi:hypothetical protein